MYYTQYTSHVPDTRPARKVFTRYPTAYIITVYRCVRNIARSFVMSDRLCGLVVRVSGYRYRGPGFDPRRYQIF